MRYRDAFSFAQISLKSIYAIDYPDIRVLIVDDGSKKKPAKLLLKYFPNLEILETNKYIEYCRSYNLGISKAINDGADYIFIVNNDTRKFSKKLFRKAIEEFNNNSKIAIVGPKCYNYVKKTNPAHAKQKKFGILVDTPAEGFIVRSSALRKIGLFNERLVRYFEDIDLVARMRIAGYLTKYIGSVSFEHFGSGSTQNQVFMMNYYRVRNIVLMIKKYKYQMNSSECLNNFLTNMRIHFDRAVSYYKSHSLVNMVKLVVATTLGLIVGVALPWAENE